MTIITGDVQPLSERAVRRDGTVAVRVITPGWGASGYYSRDVLERDAPQAFPAGTHMYLDHPTDVEEQERPERSVRDLAAVTTTAARYMTDGPDGEGVYADATIVDTWRPLVEALAPHIGVSIRAAAVISEGTADGRVGPIIERMVKGQSIDFVTQPGRGGKVVGGLREAASAAMVAGLQHITDPMRQTAADTQEGLAMTDEDREAIATMISEAVTRATAIPPPSTPPDEAAQAIAEAARLREELAVRDAREVARSMFVDGSGPLAGLNLPAPTIRRVVEQATRDVTLTDDGSLDADATREATTRIAEAEQAYLQEAAPTGVVTGAGPATIDGADPVDAPTDEQLTEAFVSVGFTSEQAIIATKGR